MIVVGSVVAGYRIERVLGAGGMGTVYLAQNPELPRRDAVKVLSAELSRDHEFRARFLREADVASTLDHPNIVSIYDRGETDSGQLWIAMQFVDGTDADDALSSGTMTPRRAVHITGEVAKALDYAHLHRVVHRDVKPANFLLSDEGGAERVLLADFGIARALDDVGLTVAGSVMATIAYAAPEVLAGTPSDGRADVYSLGCALFRLLTGKTPFSAANGMAAVVMAHLRQPPPRVTDFVPSLPAKLDSVIATAMTKDPAQRFQSAGELADAAVAAVNSRTPTTTAPWQPIASAEVSLYVSGPRTMTAPPELPAQAHFYPPRVSAAPARPHLRRRRWVIGALSAVVLLVAGTVAVLSLTGRTAPQDTTRRDTSQPSPTAMSTATRPLPPPPTVPVSALPGLLLTVNELREPVGITNPAVDSTSAAPIDGPVPLAEKECVSAWAPAQATVYDGSGFTGIQVQVITDPGDPLKVNQVTQAVAAFPTADQATRFVADQVGLWQQCSNRTLALDFPGRAPAHLTLGTAGLNANGVATISQRTDSDPPERQCGRGLADRNNVVIDTLICSKTSPATFTPNVIGLVSAKIAHQ